MFSITINLPEVLNVEVSKGSGVVNKVPLSTYRPDLIAVAALQGFTKALTDISDKELTPSALAGKRQKRVDVWATGEWASRAIDVDPLPTQMKECVIAFLMERGKVTRKVAEKRVGKSVLDYVVGIANAKWPVADDASEDDTRTANSAVNEYVAKQMARWTAEAEAVLKARHAAKADAPAIDLDALLDDDE